ncbi:neurogenin-2-like [Eriocheir sinensis]|uniref:neurogenin-2-like n=1 Tax=Eriocheir sinensis TaxID=95602 RepID=UPI0021CA1593|nr:neurogenin-2-like [Eriocheir sinensis]
MENSVNKSIGDGKEHIDTNNNNSNNNCITTRGAGNNNIMINNNNNNNIHNNNNSIFKTTTVTDTDTSSSSSSTTTTATTTATTTTTKNNNSKDIKKDDGDDDYNPIDCLPVGSFSGLAATVSAGCGGKYQLRPRSLQARRRSDSEWSIQDTLQHKPRPPPLSRYRRKTANARERYRMRQINTAFESLRGVLPSWVCSRRAAADMTKITTLRLASAYIRSLQDILDGNAPEDTCSWVLSSILGETSDTSGPQPESTKTQHTPLGSQQDSDFVSLLCSSSDTGVFQENLDSLSYLSPMSETEAMALLLGSDPPRGWSDTHHTQLVT